MPTVLGKVKRTSAGQKVGDIEDQSGANLTAASKVTESGVKKLRLSRVNASDTASTLDIEIEDLGGVVVWFGTQAEYNAITSPSDSILYVITS